MTLTGAARDSQPVALGVMSAVGTIIDDDAPPTSVRLLALPEEVAEDDGEANLILVAALLADSVDAEGEPIATAVPYDTVVSVTVADGTATEGEDYSAEAVTVTIPAGEDNSSVPLIITLVDDRLAEGDETFQAEGTTAELEVTPAVVTITDNDTPATGVTLTVTPGEVEEGAGPTELAVTAVFTGGNAVSLSVEGAVLTGDDGPTTAAGADDFTFTPAILIIPAGEVQGTARLTLTAVDDQVAEGDETARVTGSADDLAVTPAPLTFADDDLQPTSITLSLAHSQVNEGDGTADLMVTARLLGGGARTGDTLVSLSVRDVTATAGEDYSAPSNVTLTIPAGALYSPAGTLTLTVIDDDLHEGAEQLAIRGANADPGLPVSGARVSIADNDTLPTRITLSLDRNTVREDGRLQSLTITGTLAGTSTRSVETIVTLTARNQTATDEDYSAVPAQLRIKSGSHEGTATLLLAPVDDSLDEDDETFQIGSSVVRSGLQVSSLQVTITDDDTAGVTFSRTALTVVEGGSNTYTMVLDSQPSADVTVTVGGVSGDVSVSPMNLTFTTVNWSVPRALTVSAEDVTVTVAENDTVGVTVRPTDLTIYEGGSESYAVALTSQPTANVTVDIAGHSGSDLTVSSESLTFTTSNWDIAQTVTVSAAEDDDDVTDDAVALIHTATGGDYASVSGDSVTVTVTENDMPGVTVSPTALTVPERGSKIYTVVLHTQPSEDVTVDVGGESGDVSANPTSLTFTPDNWDAPQTVTVSAAEDPDIRGRHPGIPDPYGQRRRLRLGERRQRSGDRHRNRQHEPVDQRRAGVRGRHGGGVHGHPQHRQQQPGNGRLRHLQRHCDGRKRLHRHQRHADLPRQLGCQPAHPGDGAR